MPTGAFNISCPRDCVSRHNGGASGAPLRPLRVDSALRALSTLRGLRGVDSVNDPLKPLRVDSALRTLSTQRGLRGVDFFSIEIPTTIFFNSRFQQNSEKKSLFRNKPEPLRGLE